MAEAKPKSLVTGSTGFMGTRMVEILHQAGHDILATDLAWCYEKDDKKRGRFPSVLKELGVKFIASNMTDSASLKDLVKDVDYVFHIAAIFNYTAPYELLYKVNVEGTRHLCEYLLLSKKLKRLVLWGAGGVYGFVKKKDLPITEDMPHNPPNDYLRSKSEQEKLVMEMGANKGLPYSIIRPTTVYGPRAVYGGGQLVMMAATQKVSVMPMNFKFRIPFVHVDDVCRAALHLATNDKAKNEAYNLNDDSQMTYIDYFKYMAELRGNKFVLLPFPVFPELIKPLAIPAVKLFQSIHRKLSELPAPIEAPSLEFLGRDFTYSNQKLKDTGYKFVYPDARDGLKDTVIWYEKHGWIK